MRKILFLDIDGVLATRYDDKKDYPDHMYGFDPRAMAALNWLCEKVPDMEIVLSSSWRLSYWNNIKEIMSIRGFKYPERFIDRTIRGTYFNNADDFKAANGESIPRGLEIHHWLKTHFKFDEPRAYVILDDDGDMLYWQYYNFIHTRGLEGFTWGQARKARRILKQDATSLYQWHRKGGWVSPNNWAKFFAPKRKVNFQ
jgi:hypothetical protein